MTLATGIAKKLQYKAEVTWATPPGASGAQLLRRVTSDLTKKKATFESNELVSTFQRRDFRHGAVSVEGSINGELSPGTWKDFVAAAVRRAYTAFTAITGLSITVAGAGPTYTLTRGSGSYLTDGFKVGMMVRLTAGAFNAANLNKNLLVVAIGSGTVMTVMPLNGVALVAEGPIASATLGAPGKITYAPQSGHTDPSFAIEHWHSDLSLSERFDGCKVDEAAFTIPPGGMATIALKFLGKDMTTNTSAYFTAPTAETTAGVLAGPNGIIVVNGTAVGTVTSINFTIKGGQKGEPVVGSTTYADITEGRILGEGQMTVLFDSSTLRDLFIAETETSVVVALGTNTTAGAEFLSFALPRVKFGGADKDDGDKAIVQTIPFTLLENTAGGTGTATEATTFWVQDSLA